MVVHARVSMVSANSVLRGRKVASAATVLRVPVFLAVSHILVATSTSAPISLLLRRAVGSASLAVGRVRHFNIVPFASLPIVPPIIVIPASDVVLFVSVQMVRAAVTCTLENPVVPITIMRAAAATVVDPSAVFRAAIAKLCVLNLLACVPFTFLTLTLLPVPR